MELKFLWNLILRRKLVIMQAFLVILIIAIFVSLLIPDTYTSRGKIYDNYSQNTTSSILSSLGLEQIAGIFPVGGSALVEDDLQQIQMRPYLEEMARRLFLMDDDYNYLDPEKITNPGLKERVKGRPSIEITRLEETAIIEIKACSTLPEEAMQMVNTLAQIFIDQTVKRSKEQYRMARMFVEEQLNSIYAQYNSALNGFRVFQEKHGGIALSKEVELAIERMAKLMTELEDNRLELYEAESSLRNIEKQLKTSKELIVTSRELKNNDVIQTLKQKIADLNLQYAEKRVEYRKEHPAVKSIMKQVEEAKVQLREQIIKIFAREVITLNPIYEKLKKLYVDRLVEKSILEIRNKVIPKIIKRYERELKKLPTLIQEYSKLELSLKVNEELYRSLFEYKQGIGVAESMAISRLELVEPGFLPDANTPDSPERPLIIILASFVGLITGLGLAFLVDYFDDTIRDLEEIDELKDIHFLGFIPEIPPKRLAGAATIINLKPDSPIYEAYRSVRNNIRFALEEKKENSFMVTSALDGDGKTTSVCNLALAFTKPGIRVIVLDLDLRRPKVHEIFQLPNEQGISTILIKHIGYEKVVQQVMYDRQQLDVLTSGPIAMDVGLLIESAGLRELVIELKKHYEMVIVDTPPTLFISDSIIIGKYVKDVVWVMDLKVTSVPSAVQVKSSLKDAGIDILGIMVNKKQRKTGRYYYYDYYQKYYST